MLPTRGGGSILFESLTMHVHHALSVRGWVPLWSIGTGGYGQLYLCHPALNYVVKDGDNKPHRTMIRFGVSVYDSSYSITPLIPRVMTG